MMTYTVKEGDTLGAIAKQFGVPVEALFAANAHVPGMGKDMDHLQYEVAPFQKQPDGSWVGQPVVLTIPEP